MFILLILYPIDGVRASFLSEALGDTNCLRKPCQTRKYFQNYNHIIHIDTVQAPTRT